MNTELVYNYMLDCRKKEIEPFERAKLIRAYMKENKLSVRALTKQIGVPHSTIQDWLLFDKITKEEYDEFQADGFKPKQIYKALRHNKGSRGSLRNALKKKRIKSALDLELSDFNQALASRISKFRPEYHTEFTVNLVHEIKNNLNRLLMRIEK